MVSGLVGLGWGSRTGVTCDMDPAAQLALTSALLWLGKTAAAEEPEREEEAGSKDVQDPLGLKQSVFIVTPIVMVRKQPRKKHDGSSELGMDQSKT